MSDPSYGEPAEETEIEEELPQDAPEEWIESTILPGDTFRWWDRVLARRWFQPLRETRTWGLMLIGIYLGGVFLQAAIGHLGTPAMVLANQWAPVGPLSSIGDSVRTNPSLFVGVVIALELFLATSVVLGFLTRIAGFFGLLLNAFFFAAYEWADAGQLYLSWDASLAVLWAVVLLTAPGQYLGLASIIARRHPGGQAWWS